MNHFEFHKYHGSGNDFIIIDNRDSFFPADSPEIIQKLCRRCFGIGADGLILLQKGENNPYRMRFFNPDGKEAAMCGNGIRCLVDFIYRFVDPRKEYQIETLKQIITCFYGEEGIGVILKPIRLLHWEIPYSVENYDLKLFVVDTTVPHGVFFIPNLEFFDFIKVSKHIRSDLRIHPEGINVNGARIDSKNQISIRTFERGVEQETLSCGTGAAAVAYVVSTLYRESALTVIPQSQEPLKFTIPNPSSGTQEMMMTGSANWVFSGRCLI